jgi:DEAD/DEAH box helicase domain-containing protein
LVTLPALTGDKDQSLQVVLSRLQAEHEAALAAADADGLSRGGKLPDAHVTAVKRLPAVSAAYAPFPAALDDRLRRALIARGIDQLYTHQADVIDHALAGRNVVVVTPTASGKTLCYNAPVLGSVLQDGSSGILPHHPRWAKLFENLRYVVIDELHAYRGVFGSHLANIIRRLRRVCRHYGSDPVFICSSATIANPKELAERLMGDTFELVDRSGAPRGEKYFLFVNPPVVNKELGIRRSYLAETRRVAIEFLQRGLQLIVFAQSRLSTEILTTYLKDAFQGPPGAAEVIRGYRGGYLPLRRREIERDLREGVVRCVVSTNALELGIDIGALDVVVMAGYPGTIASTWQRAGRAGRRSGRSAAVLVASSAPIDQFVVRNPDFFFDASPEHALVNPDNLNILLAHVKCAAFELPFRQDEVFGTINVQEILSILSEEGFVHLTDGQWQWTQESYPADAVSLRSISSDNFVIIDTTKGERVIGETDFTSGPSTLHEKAIYIIEGQLFQVEKFDYDGRKAYVRAVECDYYTDAITYTKVTILDTFASSADGGAQAAAIGPGAAALAAGIEAQDVGPAVKTYELSSQVPPAPLSTAIGADRAHGEVHVVSRVVGFKKIKFYTNENVGSGELELPEQQMHTTSYWLTIPQSVMAAMPFGTADRRDGVIGLAHAMKNVAPLLLMCDGHDLGMSIDGLSVDGGNRLGGTVRGDLPPELSATPTIFLYDSYPGGIGFSEPLFGMHEPLLERTLDLIAGCPCESGCPSCVGPEGATGPLAKAAALHLLRSLTGEPAIL